VLDTTQPLSPGWWLKRLIEKLADSQARFEMLDSYFRGENGIPVHADKAVRLAYQRLMAMSRTNFAALGVEALRERMIPVGFRTGAEGDDQGDSEAWRIWQANSLDADFALIERAALSMSLSFVIVGGVDPEIDAPLITPEDPREVVVECAPGRRRQVVAALKVFRDDIAGADRAYLYLPGVVWKAARATTSTELNVDITGWEFVAHDVLPAQVVPVVPFPNQPDMHGRTLGEFEPHLSILDRINYSILNRLEIATLQAFRQRGIKGVPPKDEHGNDIDYDDIFAADPGALWLLPATAEMWESGVVDLNPIRQAIRDDVQDYAAVTRTPLFYLTPDSANGSAEGASLAREGLVFKAGDRIKQASESLERVMSLAFLFAGDDVRARRSDMEVMWADPARVSVAEKYDAAVKAKAAGVPWRTIMGDILGFSPQQVNRMEAEHATELLLAPDPFSTPAPVG
jgi:hypothetical protein